MLRRGGLVVAIAIGCGRLGFDVPRPGPPDASPDAPPDAASRIQLVQAIAPGFGSAANRSIAIGQLADDFLVAAVYWDENPDTVTLTDTAGLAWQSLPAQLLTTGCGGPTGNATGAQLYYAQVTSSGNNVITVAQTSGTQPLGIALLEYSGVALASEIDVTTMRMAPASSNAMSVPPLVTTGLDVIVAFFNDTINTGACAGDPAYTVEAHDNGFPNVIEDAIVPAGTYTPTATLPAGENDACWVGIAVAFRAR